MWLVGVSETKTMTKLSKKLLKLSPVVLAATVFTANSALAGEINEQVNSVAQLEQQNQNLGQVTSVSQFSDVQPTDWAFQALQSLVEGLFILKLLT
ncbi:hypothetical protein NUACC21_09380 [Scytonema sp. NUACC21]